MRVRTIGALLAIAACAALNQAIAEPTQEAAVTASYASVGVPRSEATLSVSSISVPSIEQSARLTDVSWRTLPSHRQKHAGFDLSILGLAIGSTVGSVRAKVRCNSKSPSSGPGTSTSLSFGGVYSSEPGSENKAFSDATPSLSLSMSIDHGKPAADLFEQGKDYYLDFSPAE
jgi:hypothetical protein